MDEIELQRIKQLETAIPGIWNHKTYFYIGAGEYRHHYFDIMEERNLVVDVVEIDRKNCDWLIDKHKWIRSINMYDIAEFFKDYPEKRWDCLIWSHGLSTVIKPIGLCMLGYHMKRHFNTEVHMVPNATSIGNGNVSAWCEADFKGFDYQTSTDGKPAGSRNSNLLAWRNNYVDEKEQ